MLKKIVILSAVFIFIFSGLAKAADGELQATGDWGDLNQGITSMSWLVNYNPDTDPNLVNYNYTFRYDAGHDPSYFIFELSQGAGIYNVTVDGTAASSAINTYTPNRNNRGGKYQTMPKIYMV